MHANEFTAVSCDRLPPEWPAKAKGNKAPTDKAAIQTIVVFERAVAAPTTTAKAINTLIRYTRNRSIDHTKLDTVDKKAASPTGTPATLLINNNIVTVPATTHTTPVIAPNRHAVSRRRVDVVSGRIVPANNSRPTVTVPKTSCTVRANGKP